MDFLRATRTVNWDVSTTKLTLTSDFPHADISNAMEFGAIILDDNAVQPPGEVKDSLNHT